MVDNNNVSDMLRYLEECKTNPNRYAASLESHNRLQKHFQNKIEPKIKVYTLPSSLSSNNQKKKIK